MFASFKSTIAVVFSILLMHLAKGAPQGELPPAIIPEGKLETVEVAPSVVKVEEIKRAPTHPEIIRALLDKKPVAVTAENANLSTTIPLEEADLQKLPHTTWKKLGGDVGITPLMIAAAFNDATTTDALIQAGAQRWAKTKKNHTTPVAIACATQSYDAGRFLLKSPTANQFRIEINLVDQRLRAYHNEVEILSAATSTGNAQNPTPTGTYMITEKYGKKKISTLYDANMPYFMRLNQTAVGMHAGELPGYPASHGCIRLPYTKAQELSKLVPVATQVTIIK